jgi:hypothetical protein
MNPERPIIFACSKCITIIARLRQKDTVFSKITDREKHRNKNVAQ